MVERLGPWLAWTTEICLSEGIEAQKMMMVFFCSKGIVMGHLQLGMTEKLTGHFYNSNHSMEGPIWLNDMMSFGGKKLRRGSVPESMHYTFGLLSVYKNIYKSFINKKNLRIKSK